MLQFDGPGIMPARSRSHCHGLKGKKCPWHNRYKSISLCHSADLPWGNKKETSTNNFLHWQLHLNSFHSSKKLKRLFLWEQYIGLISYWGKEKWLPHPIPLFWEIRWRWYTLIEFNQLLFMKQVRCAKWEQTQHVTPIHAFVATTGTWSLSSSSVHLFAAVVLQIIETCIKIYFYFYVFTCLKVYHSVSRVLICFLSSRQPLVSINFIIQHKNKQTIAFPLFHYLKYCIWNTGNGPKQWYGPLTNLGGAKIAITASFLNCLERRGEVKGRADNLEGDKWQEQSPLLLTSGLGEWKCWVRSTPLINHSISHSQLTNRVSLPVAWSEVDCWHVAHFNLLKYSPHTRVNESVCQSDRFWCCRFPEQPGLTAGAGNGALDEKLDVGFHNSSATSW